MMVHRGDWLGVAAERVIGLEMVERDWGSAQGMRDVLR